MKLKEVNSRGGMHKGATAHTYYLYCACVLATHVDTVDMILDENMAASIL